MSRSTPCLSVLVLTEDSSSQAHAALVALLKKSFQILVPHVGTHRIRFDPQTPPAREAMLANRWKEKRAHQKRVSLRRAIATRVLEQDPPGFVAFHIDGDRAWADRETSENRAKFQQEIKAKVRLLLENNAAKTGGSADSVDDAMSRLIEVVPFYSIESWLYQNFTELRRLCPEPDHETIDSWAADRAALDEVLQPKEALSIGAMHNQRLAKQGWPANAVYEAGASFTAFVDDLIEATDLNDSLEATSR